MSDHIKAHKDRFKFRFGSEKHHLEMIDGGKLSGERRCILSKTGGKPILDKLVDDRLAEVRNNVALRGDKEHHDKLMHDSNYHVRGTVAEHGSKEHREHLLNDENPMVRRLAKTAIQTKDFPDEWHVAESLLSRIKNQIKDA